MRRHLRWLVPVVFYLLLAGFIAYYLTTIDYALLATATFDWRWIVAATVVGLASRWWMVLIWLTILRGLGATRFESVSTLGYVYSKAWLGRYIPGTAPWILGKIYFASQHGLSKRKLAVSSLLEGGLQALVLMVVGLLLIALDPRAALVDPVLLVLIVAAALVGIVVLLPPVFNRLLALVFRVARRTVLEGRDLPGYRVVATGAGMYVVGALLTGASMFLVARAVWADLPWSEFWFCVGALALASAVSMLAIFAPSGLGVREALIVALLSVIMPTEFALVTAVATRLWSIGVDFLFFGASWSVMRLRRRPLPPTAVAPVAPSPEE